MAVKRLVAQVRASEGIAIGRAFVVRREAVGSSEPKGDVECERARFFEALAASDSQIEQLAVADEIFAAHLELLRDDTLRESVEGHIAEGESAVEAVEHSCDEIAALFEQMDDEYLRERANDVRDIFARIKANLTGGVRNPFEGVGAGDIVVDSVLLPSDMAMIDFSRVAGFVTGEGGATSHVCIIARNRSIPAVVGLHEALAEIPHGEQIVVDGTAGVVVVAPDEVTLAEYRDRMARERAEREAEREMAHIELRDAEGRKVSVRANAGSVEEVREAIARGADGVGLFRSEFLYMLSDAEPSEQMQAEAYGAAAEACGDAPLTIRTLDVGGDKPLPYMTFPREENPFMGWRAIRVSLAERQMFCRQLRAILRASARGRVRVMFPMVVSVEELREAKACLEECKRALRSEGVAFDEHIPVGVMIETPAAVFVARALAAECDFFSIGTNDLTQYVMAADRANTKVAALCNPLSEAVVAAIRMSIEAAAEAGIECSMCGEMASDAEATELLLACGLRSLSVNIGAIGRIKHRVAIVLQGGGE